MRLSRFQTVCVIVPALALITLGTLRCASLPLSSGSRRISSLEPGCDYRFFDPERLQILARTGTVHSIDDLVHATPQCFKLNQVAVYDSGSLHCSTFKAPRVILYLNELSQSVPGSA